VNVPTLLSSTANIQSSRGEKKSKLHQNLLAHKLFSSIVSNDEKLRQHKEIKGSAMMHPRLLLLPIIMASLQRLTAAVNTTTATPIALRRHAAT